eukprot:TRINITY_DN2445_c0_g1_i2.p1 TRINITY_DN2445_c0_g1~~TRINITY_DN2445_c0_g1_i2.p1  ORF type:complete len:458 (+),score=128.36 TRINITY_DN2445_c0_g1_i2:87-1460(+)
MHGGDPYEPIIGGHKSHSLERELRERGLHASANAVAAAGDEHYEGPQGHPAPGSGSPRRNRVTSAGSPRRGPASRDVPCAAGSYDPPQYTTAPEYSYAPQSGGYGSHAPAPVAFAAHAPATSHAGQVPPATYGQPAPTSYAGHMPPPPSHHPAAAPPSHHPAAAPSAAAVYAAPPPAASSYAVRSDAYAAPPAAGTFAAGPAGHPSDSYEPIIGGHKSHSLERELRERGLHASANAVAAAGDEHYEGPQGHPAPGSGSPRRNHVTSAGSPRRGPASRDVPIAAGSPPRGPADTYTGSPAPHGGYGTSAPHSGYGHHGSPAPHGGGGYGQHSSPAPHGGHGSYGQHGSPAPHGGYGTSAPHSGYGHHGSPAPHGGGGYGQHSSPAPHGGYPHHGSPAPHGAAGDGYEPQIGGHKTNSYEKELRDRGLHASANEVAERGGQFYTGPGSPQRNRVTTTGP